MSQLIVIPASNKSQLMGFGVEVLWIVTELYWIYGLLPQFRGSE